MNLGKKLTKLIAEERLLVATSCIGFLLAFFLLIYMFFYGKIILPEGNAESAFSFNAAIAIFILTIALLLPFAGMKERRRAVIRWLLIISSLVSYAIETIQHLRGLNPRFTQEGSTIDQILGGVFGLVSIIIVLVTVLLTLAFFRHKRTDKNPLLIHSTRYAFVSIMIANAAGIWMIALQSRYLGDTGNFIVLHGLGYHALQALPLMGWLLDRYPSLVWDGRQIVHLGSMAWLLSLVLIWWQTSLGETVFQFSLLPIIASISLLVWLAMFCLSLLGIFSKRIKATFLSQ